MPHRLRDMTAKVTYTLKFHHLFIDNLLIDPEEWTVKIS
jgi:hypothetical protein